MKTLAFTLIAIFLLQISFRGFAQENDYVKELAKIKSGCPANNIVPYSLNGKWGYLHKQTQQKITNAIFDELSFVGKTGHALLDGYKIKFTCEGKVLERWAGNFDNALIDNPPEYDTDPKRTKGFTVRDGKIISYSAQYPSFKGIKIDEKRYYAIVSRAGRQTLIDSSGTVVKGFERFTSLGSYSFGKENEKNFLFVYRDSTRTFGIIDKDFKIAITNLSLFRFPQTNRFDLSPDFLLKTYLYLKVADKWGIWNGETKQWAIQPEYEEIIRTDRTFTGEYEEYPNSGETIDLYFLVKQEGQIFFIDLNNKKYLLK